VSQSSTVTVAQYLLQRFEDLGVSHVFGIPGDYVLPFFDELVSSRNSLVQIGTCNEVNAGYAANGYARLNGFGVAATTYGPGAFNAVNAVAEAMSDSVAMVLVSGAPNTDEYSRKGRYLHHVIGDNFQASLDVFTPITVQATRLMDAETAPDQIDEILMKSLNESKPVYLEIPYDIQEAECRAPGIWHHRWPTSDASALQAAVDRTAELLAAAKSPAILPGMWIERNKLQDDMAALIRKTRIPFATSFDGKAAYIENMEECIGFYQGKMSGDTVGPVFDNADLILTLGWDPTEFNTGMYSETIATDRLIAADNDKVTVQGEVFDSVYLRDFLPALVERVEQTSEPRMDPYPEGFDFTPAESFVAKRNEKMSIDRMYRRLAHFLQAGDVVYGDTGGYLNSTRMRHPAKSVSVGNGNWGSLGFGFAATVGAAFAAGDKRVICLEGDGAFQMTAQELSTLVKHDQDVLIIVLNNGGYTAERAIEPTKRDPYNNIQNWEYHSLGQSFGQGKHSGEEIHTEEEFDQALIKHAEPNGPIILNVHLAQQDVAAFNAAMSQSMQH
jgi:TPP-dependent 2-oxoacid decarboxylase